MPERAWGFKSPLSHHCDVSDIVHTCPGTSFHVMPDGLIAPGRIEDELAQELSVLGHDPYRKTGHGHHHSGPGMPTTHLDVVQPAVMAKRDGPDAIDPFPAHPVGRRDHQADRGGPRTAGVGDRGRPSHQRPVGTVVVVVSTEPIERLLELNEDRSRFLFGEESLERQVPCAITTTRAGRASSGRYNRPRNHALPTGTPGPRTSASLLERLA